MPREQSSQASSSRSTAAPYPSRPQPGSSSSSSAPQAGINPGGLPYTSNIQVCNFWPAEEFKSECTLPAFYRITTTSCPPISRVRYAKKCETGLLSTTPKLPPRPPLLQAAALQLTSLLPILPFVFLVIRSRRGSQPGRDSPKHK